ncbi:hypothetical protein [Nocardia sp. NPDC051463]|uniref:hypothetical protein n=1 Tax=Nocardia sp. NPDC051463 TaxID=3154845 RepID=UPI00344FEFFE
MSAKPTLRRSGTRMFTIRARFDFDVNELIDRIAHRTIDYDDDLPGSRDAALKLARDHCAEYGNSKEVWGEDFADEWDGHRASVADRVRLVFPELSGEIK